MSESDTGDKVKVLSHRGYWKAADEKNKEIAFVRSFELGFGIETDIRDSMNNLVVSHDPPNNDAIQFDNFMKLASNYSNSEALTLALNIKSDGLASDLKRAIDKFPQLDYFVFDMSVPDMRSYLDLGIPTFTRMSEVEKSPAWLDRSAGVWLDAFEYEWYTMEDVEALLRLDKRVCIVSPELHGRSYTDLWAWLKQIDNPQLILCTDYPDEANDYFNEALR